MKKTNFDHHLDTQLKDKAFAERFEQAGQAWDEKKRLPVYGLQCAAKKTKKL